MLSLGNKGLIHKGTKCGVYKGAVGY